MNGAGILMAELTGSEVQVMRQPWTLSGFPYILTIVGILIGVSLAACLLIVAFRRLRKRRHRHHHHDERHAGAVRPAQAQKRRRRRRRSGTQRPFNPTLAETGGLPPVRDANTPPPGL